MIAPTRARWRRWAALATLVLVLVASAGCGGGGGDDALRLGYLPNITNAAALVGVEEGIFDETVTSLPVDTRKFSTGTEASAALLSGSLDAGYMGMGPVITMLSRAPGSVRVLSGAGEAGAVLVARRGTGIRTVADLRGRRVGFPGYGNTQDLALLWELGRVGLTGGRNGDVTTVRIRNADLRTAFQRGALDAALCPEPWGSALVAAGLADIVLPADRVLDDGRYPTTVLVVNASWADDHPEAVAELLDAHRRAVRRAASDPDAVAAAFAEIAGSSTPPPAVLRAGVAANRVTTRVDARGTEELLRAARDAGYLGGPVTLRDLLPR